MLIIPQRSQEWFESRKGRLTSSEIYKIMGDKGFAETAKSYLLEKVCEHFGGYTAPATGASLEWGTELEPVAIKHYEAITGAAVESAPFIPVNEYYGGSPDGLIIPDGIIEVKCPHKSANHFKHGMINTPEKFKKIAPNYYYQCISNMLCAEATWCDFISYDPRVAEDYRMFIYRLQLDEQEAMSLIERVSQAIDYMKELKQEIEATNPRLLQG